MKTTLRLLVLFLLFFVSTPAVQADDEEKKAVQFRNLWGEDVNKFLADTYGWKFEMANNPWLGRLMCPEERVALATARVKTAARGWICRQEDWRYWTIVIWRLPDTRPEVVEEGIYRDMSKDTGWWKNTKCEKEEVVAGETKKVGTVNDCNIELRMKRPYVSFFHFDAEVPPYMYASKDGELKTATTLGFTIVIQNAGTDDPSVKEKIRGLASSIRPAANKPVAK